MPMRPKVGPAACRVPSLEALTSRNSTGSMPILSQSSSTSDSAAKAATGEPALGRRRISGH